MATTTDKPNYTDLLHALRTDTSTAEAVLEAVAFAGSQPTWDSETIENVLYPLIVLVESHGAPGTEATPYWRSIAKDMGAEFPEEEEEEYTPDQAEHLARVLGNI